MTRSADFKQRAQGVDRLLRGLLRSPKTRQGLAAALADRGLSESVVDGWLARSLAAGLVAKARCGETDTFLYVLSGREARLPGKGSCLPAWLDPPITLPEYSQRRVYRGGVLEGNFDEH